MRKGWAGVIDGTPVAAWLIEAAPSAGVALAFAAVYAVYLARVHFDARRRVSRFLRRRRALERVETWYPEGRLLPSSLIAARARLAAERRALVRAGIFRPSGRSRAS
ncbi:MAG TPA: hypothetical protein VGK61_03145 [Planctomycetota bacterium]